MTGYLLDTHVVLWWLSESPQLSSGAKRIIRNRRNRAFVSVGAVWEMIIKRSVGRLDFPSNLLEVLEAEGISLLDISIRHVLRVAELPSIHRDPFDRIQVAQAQIESLVLVTRDASTLQYDVPTLLA